MRKPIWLAVAVCTAVLSTAAGAGEDERAGGVRLKIQPMQPQPQKGMMQGQRMSMGQQGQPMPMMQQCMQWHQRLMTRLDALEQKVDHILKERERESHEQLTVIEEKLAHMSQEIDHILAEREKESHQRLQALEEKLDHMSEEIDHILKEGEKEAHERLSAIEKKLDHVLQEQEQETH